MMRHTGIEGHSRVKNRLHTSMCLSLMVAFYANACSAQSAATRPAGERLKFALVLTRHGVRSPTWTNARLDEYSKDAWPSWDVAPGFLTPHGKKLMNIFGAYYRSDFSSHGLLSSDGCSDARHVYFYADVDERTVESAHGLAEGMLPGCDIEVHSNSQSGQDLLFHGSDKPRDPNAKFALAAVGGRIGSDPARLLPAYQGQLEAMQKVLLACEAPRCTVTGKKALLGVAPSLTQASGDHLVELKGPLTTGATFAENFQLEYLEGMPAAQVGWGRVEEKKVRELMTIHAASSDILQRTPYIARVQASNLLSHMLRTLQQAESQKLIAGAIGNAKDKVVVLVGHDTNISNVAALLDAHWLVNGYQRDDAAPGGALVFELWTRPKGEDVVRAYYTVQLPEQMRESQPLSPADPPGRATIFIPACSQPSEDSPCRWNTFRRLLDEAILPGFAK
jgi:4-phytase/acid phosphatase